jgi:hypothetical protein
LIFCQQNSSIIIFVSCATTKISLPIPLLSILMFIKLIWSKHKLVNDKLQRANC